MPVKSGSNSLLESGVDYINNAIVLIVLVAARQPSG